MVGSCDIGLVLLEILRSLGHAIPIKSLFVHQTGAMFHGLDPRWSLDHAIVPRLDTREPFEPFVVGNAESCIETVVPRDEGQIRECNTVAHEPLLSFGLGGEDPVKDTKHTLDLIGVALDS